MFRKLMRKITTNYSVRYNDNTGQTDNLGKYTCLFKLVMFASSPVTVKFIHFKWQKFRL